MCTENINNISSFDFSQTNDEINWFNNSSNAIVTDSGKLVLRPDSVMSVFSRWLGLINVNNNRLRFKLNFEVFRPTNGGTGQVKYLVQIFNGLNLIGQSYVYIGSINSGQSVKYSLDRTYQYEQLSGNISIKIKSVLGYENEIRLEKLDVEDFNFCEDSVRTYFVFDDFFNGCLTAQSGGLRLLKWKIDGIETLTADFLAHNQINLGGNPVAQFKFGTADLDGANRISATAGQNTFNPFVDDFGLVFDTINSFHGGKPTGTVTSQNFGAGVMQLGLEKPEILNGLLQPKKGAFFIDIDYSQDLYIEIDVVVNQNNPQLFTNPTIFRKYFIIWDSIKCQKSFYYLDKTQDNNQQIDQTVNGFLSGLTSVLSTNISKTCSQSVNFDGDFGSYSFEVDFGDGIGMAGIDYNSNHIPNKFDINYNGQTYSSGYVGCNEYNQQLINAGVPTNQINTSPHSGNGVGQLLFYKNGQYPKTAIVTVTSVIEKTKWGFAGICPFVLNFTEISWEDTHTTEDRTGSNNSETIYKGNVLFPVISEVWQKNINGAGWVDFQPVISPTENFNIVVGVNEFRIKALSGGNSVYSNVLKYTKIEITAPIVGGISFLEYNNVFLNICIALVSDGGTAITECGVVYNTTGNPTILDNKIIFDNSLQNECKIFTRPTVGQPYFFSVFYTNSVGTTYIDYPFTV